MDQTPVIVMQMVQQRLNNRYPIANSDGIDPSIVALHRQQLTSETNAEFELALEQTVQLMQQYETDEDIQRVAGGEPWEYSRKDIQGQYDVSAAVDINLIDNERAQAKLTMLAQLMPFKDSGGMVFNAAANIVDPDLADALGQDQMSPTAMQKEQSDEYNAIGQILAGVEAVKPMMANNQFRLQTIQQIMSDPATMQRVQQDPVAQKRLQNRVEFFQNQIQQFQANPQIGRTLATQTFAPNQPGAVSQAPTQ
jgi:hypothetical protein